MVDSSDLNLGRILTHYTHTLARRQELGQQIQLMAAAAAAAAAAQPRSSEVVRRLGMTFTEDLDEALQRAQQRAASRGAIKVADSGRTRSDELEAQMQALLQNGSWEF